MSPPKLALARVIDPKQDENNTEDDTFAIYVDGKFKGAVGPNDAYHTLKLLADAGVVTLDQAYIELNSQGKIPDEVTYTWKGQNRTLVLTP